MATSTYRRRGVKRVDRLSTLPAELRSQIMSLLPTVDAARVSVLSKPLRSAYYSLSSLYFDNVLFPRTRNKLLSFANFIKTTVDGHDESDITTFKLLSWPNFDCDVLLKPELITFAILHRAQKLILYGTFEDEPLPECLLTCETLVKLDLTLKDHVLTTENFALVNLRKLKLKLFIFDEQHMGNALFRNLPSLKKLSLLYCEFAHGDISIWSESLEELVFCYSWVHSCSLKLHTPRLSKFIYINNDGQNCGMDVSPSGLQFFITSGDVAIVNGNVNNLLPLLIKVTKDLFMGTYLSLCHWHVEYLSMAYDLLKEATSCPFHGILILNVEIWPIMDHLTLILMLISRCPNLKRLDILLRTPEREARQLLSEDSLAEYANSSGVRSVQYTEIKNFGGGEAQLMLVRFLLANMVDLVGMKIVLGDLIGKERRETIFEILEYERASELVNFG